MSFIEFESMLPLYALLASFAAIPFILLSGRKPNLRESFTILAAVVKFSIVLMILPATLEGRVAVVQLLEIADGISLTLKADMAGVFFALIASGLWIFTSFYSIGYMRGHDEKKQTRYFASFAFALTSTIGVAFSGNLFTFIIFYELLTLSTYPLVIHSENDEAIKAGRKYLIYTLPAGLLLIAAAVMIYNETGSLDFAAGGILADAAFSGGEIKTLFVLLITGTGVKAGIMPFHSWLPSAMAAPTPVSALLHAVAVVKSGVFGVLRMTGYIIGPELMAEHGLHILLAIFSGATVILASIMALRQDNLKRRLAYSTIGHLSYIVFGFALLTPAALLGGVLHIMSHATMKITLFFTAGAIMVNLHRKNISQLDGIGRVMPFSMAAFTIGSMGLAGIPPVNGFLSKFYLGLGGAQTGELIPVALYAFSGLLNAAYFFPIVHRAFFKKGSGLENHTEASPFMVVPLFSTAVLSVLFGIYPDLFFNMFDMAETIRDSILFGGLK